MSYYWPTDYWVDASPSPTKLTYLQLVNTVLKRITQAEISTVAGATGQAKIISEMINEAQVELWTETTNWHSLYAERTFSTVANTATYLLANDWGRTIGLMDITTNIILTEDFMRTFDESSPDASRTGTTTNFAIQGGSYVFFPIPASTSTIRERYWKIPTKLAVDIDTSSLPLFCENFLIHWAWMSILDYLNKFEQSDRVRMKIYGNPSIKDPGILQKCKAANSKILDKMIQFRPTNDYRGLQPPRFPAHY